MLKNKTIAFLGAGSMAEAMISGIVKSGLMPASHVIATNKSNVDRLNDLKNKYGIKGIQRDQLNMKEVDIIILAMKPKDIDAALDSLKDEISPNHVIVSVLAGISTARMEEGLPEGQQVLRVMPNTSSMLQESATAVAGGRYVSMDTVLEIKHLLSAIGEVYLIDEKQMDIFTGIAGSGPAYFYYLMEHIEKVGQQEGLDKETARNIGAQTILGAARMMLEQSDSPTELRKKVTSPNGTTAAGLEALRENGGGTAISEAVKSAARKSEEISAKFEKQLVVQ
ncbi:pyrroline-5-carboxylate reductase [Falsibacillus pallidus]|uniref:Pyrroline-5-carboxylate reductase n=1 Tax=Falsibacillus pallidus TaxID=493781 RepID=A0A370GQK3_9BACI|nr:pyrroline-5-carboxylate reductase [Falsibacillus pallidus]RDI45957.1 pyrroline-5-carboxylate reductase [Falsibacillus pallidus]